MSKIMHRIINIPINKHNKKRFLSRVLDIRATIVPKNTEHLLFNQCIMDFKDSKTIYFTQYAMDS
jgi:hypothetical protein